MSNLIKKKCRQISKQDPALTPESVVSLMKEINSQWQLSSDKLSITREFKFKNFYHTMAFVNAMAYIAHQEDHHPDFEVGYNRCLIKFSTHSIGGLSENDFICAAKIDQLEQ